MSIQQLLLKGYGVAQITGGTVTTSGSETIHRFTDSGSLVIPSGVPAGITAKVLVVGSGGGGGGGSAGAGGGGGGGAGALHYKTSVPLPNSDLTIPVTIGAYGGGGGSNGSDHGGAGAACVFNHPTVPITALPSSWITSPGANIVLASVPVTVISLAVPAP